MRKNNTALVTVVFCIGLLMIFVIAGRQINSQVMNNKSKTVKKTQPAADLSETSILTVPESNFRQSGKGKQTAVSVAPAVGADLGEEVEPNNNSATANVLGGSEVKIRGDIFGNGDIDFYSFTANAGDRVYATVTTNYSASASTDSQLRIIAADGVTEIEFDEDDGSLGTLASSIAGAELTAGGTYYVRVNHFSATNTLRPYELYVSVESGAPTPEVEPNDTAGTANPLPASGHVSGARNPAVATEQDWYSMTLNAGDTVFLSLDLDPENDITTWNGRLGMALFGDANNQILVVDDGGTVDTADSEAFVMTVKTAGTYYAFVDSATAATGGPTATYNLSVTIIPKVNIGVNCTTYTSTDVPQTIGPGAGLVSSTLTVPPTMAKIASTKVSINATHALMADMDVNLRSPNSNNNGLFNDIGSTATGGQTMMDLTLDQYSAGVPFVFTAVRPLILKPELNYRLDWFDGENPSGVWTLDIRDDLTNASGGTLNSWSLELCEQTPPAGMVVYTENFEASDGGFTHSGAADEWEYGTPNTPATTTTNPVADFIGCGPNGGTNCWKTDLDGTYEVSSNQELISPPILLPAQNGMLTLSWDMRYQFESATFDHAFVEIREVGGMGVNQRVWEWTGATMTVAPGSPVVNIGESAGWGTYQGNASTYTSLGARTVQIVFHVDSDTSINFAGMAIDNVQLNFVPVVAANASVSGRVADTKGNGVANALVTLTGFDGTVHSARTNSFGNYIVNDVQVGEAYAANVRSKGYSFASQVITVNNDLTDVDFTAEE